MFNVTINFSERRNKGPLYFKSDRISAYKMFFEKKSFPTVLALLNLEWLCISRSMSGKALNKTLNSNRDTVYASRFTLRVLFCKISDAWVHPSTRSKICFWRKTDLRDLNTSQAAQNFVWLSINYLYHLLKSWFSRVVAIKAAWKWDSATDCLDPQNPVHLWLTNNFYDKSSCPQWMISDKLPSQKPTEGDRIEARLYYQLWQGLPERIQ